MPMNNSFITANNAWLNMLHDVQQYGSIVSPREIKCTELLNYTSKIDMCAPILTHPVRELGYRFQAAEAAWILSGDNRTSTIKPYSKEIGRFSDDGVRFFGSYGPKIIDQLPYVARVLSRDFDSRQAVITIWRESPYDTKDVPCTVSLQFLIRNSKLNCIATMRSSDAWLGWPYDVFNFTMISAAVAIYLYEYNTSTYKLGKLYLNAGSQHIYFKDRANVAKVMAHVEPCPEFYDFEPLKWWYNFDSFLKSLWDAANGPGSLETFKVLSNIMGV